MARKSMREFIAEHRELLGANISAAIYRYDDHGGRGVIPHPAPKYNDRERRFWILNDGGLYRWARSEGVQI